MTTLPTPTSRGAMRCAARAVYRVVACWVLVAASTVLVVATEPFPAATSSAGADADAELERLAAEFGIDLRDSLWDVTGSVETTAGYRDNTTLSPFTPDASAFVSAAISGIAWCRPQGRFDWMNVVDVSATHFLGADTDKALLVLGRSEARWRHGEPVEFTLAAQVIHQDEVIDVSTLDYGLGSARVRLLSSGLEAKVRWAFAANWSLTSKIDGRWNDFRAPLDDTLESAAGVTLERTFGRWGELGVTYRGLRRDYGSRPQAAIGGRELDGTELAVVQHAGEVHYRVSRGDKFVWSARLRAGYLESSDNGTGWYDYARTHAAATLSLEHAPWRVELDVDWRDYEYRLQTSGFGVNPPARQRREIMCVARLERDVGEQWALLFSAEVDRSRSNDAYLEYDDALASAGLRWTY